MYEHEKENFRGIKYLKNLKFLYLRKIRIRLGMKTDSDPCQKALDSQPLSKETVKLFQPSKKIRQ